MLDDVINIILSYRQSHPTSFLIKEICENICEYCGLYKYTDDMCNHCYLVDENFHSEAEYEDCYCSSFKDLSENDLSTFSYKYFTNYKK